MPIVLHSDAREEEEVEIDFGELLFPSFNQLCLLWFEHLPELDEFMLGVFHRLITFAFKTQVFPTVTQAPQMLSTQQKKPVMLEFTQLPTRLFRRREQESKLG